MKKNQNGFSALIILVLIVVIGAIGFAGWRIFGQQSDTDAGETASTKVAESQSASPESSYTYTVANGWSKLTCGDTELVYPDDDKATDCNDRTNLINVSQDTYAVAEPVHCMSAMEVETAKQSKPLESYDCTELTIDGAPVMKETTNQGTDENGQKASL